MNWLGELRRRWVIRRYAKRLGPALARRYGRCDTYTEGQIRATAEQLRLPMTYIGYGYAMYLGQQGFAGLQPPAGAGWDYGAMRQEVADLHFGGSAEFTPAEITAGSIGGGWGGDGGFGGDIGGGDMGGGH